jgi:hypothetical protein
MAVQSLLAFPCVYTLPHILTAGVCGKDRPHRGNSKKDDAREVDRQHDRGGIIVALVEKM